MIVRTGAMRLAAGTRRFAAWYSLMIRCFMCELHGVKGSIYASLKDGFQPSDPSFPNRIVTTRRHVYSEAKAAGDRLVEPSYLAVPFLGKVELLRTRKKANNEQQKLALVPFFKCPE